MRSLVERVNRLKSKLTKELQTTVSYLRYHFSQRSVYDKKMQAHHLYHNRQGALGSDSDEADERMLVDEQKPLKELGKIEGKLKDRRFENVIKPSI